MPTATVTSKGQVTIPIEVRQKLGIQTGSRVEFAVRADGGYEIFVSTGSISDLRGMFTWDGPPVTIEEMNDAIAEAATERYLNL